LAKVNDGQSRLETNLDQSDAPSDPEELRLSKLAIEANLQYEALGRFIAKFEHLCQTLRFEIGIFLGGNLLRQRLVDILLSEVTAMDLTRDYFSMLPEVMTVNPFAEDLFRNVRKRITFLIETRNWVVHNALYIGWASTTDTELGPASGLKANRRYFGLDYESRSFGVSDFNEYALEADKLTQLIHRIGGVVLMGLTMENNFQKLADGQWIDSGPSA